MNEAMKVEVIDALAYTIEPGKTYIMGGQNFFGEHKMKLRPYVEDPKGTLQGPKKPEFDCMVLYYTVPTEGEMTYRCCGWIQCATMEEARDIEAKLLARRKS